MQRAVGAILRNGNRFLLGHRHPGRSSFPDVWDVPGGRIEQPESAAVAVARELREELGIDVGVATLVPWRTVATEGYELTLFVIDDWAGKVKNADPSEHDRLQWFTTDELTSLSLASPAYVSLIPAAMQAT